MRRADRYQAFSEVCVDEVTHLSHGPLAGASFVVKDNIEVAGRSFSAGHPLFADRRGKRTATVVEWLREAGACVAGMGRTDAGGFGVTTPEVINPIDPGRIVGGSSGGVAAAVAAGLVDFGVGTDTGGSVRIPAACCGLYGFKPSYGLIPLDGVWPLASGFDHVGWMAPTLDMVRRVADVVLPGNVNEGAASPDMPRVGIDVRALAHCADEVAGRFLRAVDATRAAGVPIVDVILPSPDEVMEVHGVLVLAQARDVYSAWWPEGRDRLGAAARPALTVADMLTEADIAEANRRAAAIEAYMVGVHEQVDCVMTPALSVPVPRVGARKVTIGGKDVPVLSALIAQTCLFNLTGTPALVLPFRDEGSFPTMLQLSAARMQDWRLLHWAAALSASLD